MPSRPCKSRAIWDRAVERTMAVTHQGQFRDRKKSHPMCGSFLFQIIIFADCVKACSSTCLRNWLPSSQVDRPQQTPTALFGGPVMVRRSSTWSEAGRLVADEERAATHRSGSPKTNSAWATAPIAVSNNLVSQSASFLSSPVHCQTSRTEPDRPAPTACSATE